MTIEDITARLGITPTAMQEATIDALLHSNDDIVLLSPTGTGKTLAYLLPLTQMIDTASGDVQAVVITPGRELAMQSRDVLQSLKAGVRGMACYGGRPAMDEHRQMRQLRPHVIFGTPGRLNDHIDKGNFAVDHVRLIVIDEFDKCLDMGFRNEMSWLVRKLPRRARAFFLSATDSTFDEFTRRFRRLDFRPADGDGTKDGERQPQAERVAIFSVKSPSKDKLETLGALLCNLQGSSVVFVNYRDSVERTADYLRSKGFVVAAYHGGLEQKEREAVLYRFVNGSANVMVSTDLGSRGLDIPDIRNIIHYHLPESEDSYIHRVGRTARWDKSGQSFFILSPEETVPEYVSAEAQVTEYDLPEETPPPPQPLYTTIYIGKGKKDKISRGDIVGFFCKTGGLDKADIGRIDVRDHYAYAAVRRDKAPTLLRHAQGQKIKGIKTVFETVR